MAEYRLLAAASAGRRPRLAEPRGPLLTARYASLTPAPNEPWGGVLPEVCPKGRLVPIMTALTWSGVYSGCRSSSSATSPDTTAVAIDVPVRRKYVVPLVAVTRWSGSNLSSVLPAARTAMIFRPGATRSGLGVDSAGVPYPENQPITSSPSAPVSRSSLAPTVRTYGSAPGESTAPPVLPEAATTTRPCCQAISTAAASGSAR